MPYQASTYDPLTQIAALALATLVAFIGLVMIVAGRRAAERITGGFLRFFLALLLLPWLLLALAWIGLEIGGMKLALFCCLSGVIGK